MIKILLFILLVYLAFAWGYGFTLFLNIFNEIREDSSELRKQGKPVYMAIPVMIVLWIGFPLLWPFCEIFVEAEDQLWK